MTDKLKEDTVSADRKERIIFDPEAWRKSDKSGRKTSAITSRQNFDNEKFTRKAKEEQVDEGTIQPSGDSKVDSAGPTQSDTISQDKKVKKSNNPQIEFVTGTATPNGSSSTTQGGAQAMGRKLSEALIEKAIKKVKSDAGVPFDGPYTKPGEHKDEFGNTVKTKNVPGFLAKRAMRKAAGMPPVKESAQYAGLEKEDKPGKKATEFKGSKNSITGKTVEGWKDEKAPVKEEIQHVEEACKEDKKKKLKQEENDMSLNKEGWDPEQFGSDGSGAGRPGGAGAGDIGKTDKKKKSAKPMKEGKTYSQFMEELDELVEFVPEAIEEGIKIKTATGYIHKGTRGYGNDSSEFDQNDDFDSDDKPKAKPADAPKRGRGRPAGSYGTYKARSAETKAAAAAKSAATKAANKAK